MKNLKKQVLFILIIFVGLVLIDRILIGLNGPDCNCFDGRDIEDTALAPLQAE